MYGVSIWTQDISLIPPAICVASHTACRKQIQSFHGMCRNIRNPWWSPRRGCRITNPSHKAPRIPLWNRNGFSIPSDQITCQTVSSMPGVRRPSSVFLLATRPGTFAENKCMTTVCHANRRHRMRPLSGRLPRSFCSLSTSNPKTPTPPMKNIRNTW